jgi:hypothetical protein
MLGEVINTYIIKFTCYHFMSILLRIGEVFFKMKAITV